MIRQANSSIRRRSLCLAAATAATLSFAIASARAQTTVPFATVSGVIAVHYNDNGGGENPANQAYLRAQFSETNTNGGVLNFDSTPLPGGGGLSWYLLFQAVPDQFGFDMVLETPTADGSNPPPVVTAYDNTDNSLPGAAPAGPVTWAISGYTGATNGPADPANGIINSLIRGGSGAPSYDGVTITSQTLRVSGTVFTMDIAGELDRFRATMHTTRNTELRPGAGVGDASSHCTRSARRACGTSEPGKSHVGRRRCLSVTECSVAKRSKSPPPNRASTRPPSDSENYSSDLHPDSQRPKEVRERGRITSNSK